jgi:head-tail adaptor
MKVPAAGKYDRRIQFVTASNVDDGMTVKEVFAPTGPRYWARVVEFQAVESQAGGQVQATIQTRFIVRRDSFTASILPTARIEYDGKVYDITGRMEAGGRLAEVQFTATARNDL